MYEGKNLHYSPVDQKPLCSFSGKVCNQRRLNKYGFCVRHILEDHNAPFKRCAYVAKSSRQTCTQPIPKNEEREYCNNHMQVLGMLPKKERKPKKEKEKAPYSALVPQQTQTSHHVSDSVMLQNKVKPRLTIGGFKTKLVSSKQQLSTDDVDDVYAFPADSSDKSSTVSTMITSVALPDTSSDSSKTVTYNTYTTTKSQSDSGSSSLAKIYPELAEKLEKIKPRVEPKVKGKVKSSRTMNSLQTKIAQNKIKDKLKRNQGSSNTSSQSQSPSHGFVSASSPNYHESTSSPGLSLASTPPTMAFTQPGGHSLDVSSTHISGSNLVTTTPSVLTSINSTSVSSGLSTFSLFRNLDLRPLNFAQIGLPYVSDIEQTLKQLAKATNLQLGGSGQIAMDSTANPAQPTTFPAVGLPTATLGSTTADLLGIMRPGFPAPIGPPPPYSSVHHRASSATGVTSANVNKPVISDGVFPLKSVKKDLNSQPSAPSLSEVFPSKPHVPQQVNNFVPTSAALSTLSSHVPVSTLSSSSSSSSSSVHLSDTLVNAHTLTTKLKSGQLASLPPFPTQLQSSLTSPYSSSPSVLKSLSSHNCESVKQNHILPVDVQKSKPTKPRVRSRNVSTASKRPLPVCSLPMTVVKPRKMPKLLEPSEVNKLGSKSAVELYEKYKQKKVYHHNLILSGFDSSDESDMSDCDTLPWQPEWFRASSDEEMFDEEEDLEDDLRTAKLALTRARLRRQCFQYKVNANVT